MKSIFVDLHEGTKDYVTGYLYHNGALVATLADIRKPDNVEQYTTVWKNGLWVEYKRQAIEKGLVSSTDYVTYI